VTVGGRWLTRTVAVRALSGSEAIALLSLPVFLVAGGRRDWNAADPGAGARRVG
jgi:hypothetical protein